MSEELIGCEKEECPCDDCTDEDVPMQEEAPAEDSRILKPGQDPRTLDLDSKVRAEKCWEAIKIVCGQFDCQLEGVAILKNGSVQTAVACTPVKRLSEEQIAAMNAVKAAGGE